jgi:hypothetical protein
MAEEHGPEEVQQRYVTAMGQDLGQLFHLLWNECAWLHLKWSDYMILFGNRPERVLLLNQAAPTFFKLVQDAIWEDTLLHICRLTDPPKSSGRDNLTLRRLLGLVPAEIRPDVDSLLQLAILKSEFARDWRNRKIAHRDLRRALSESTIPLAPASRKSVQEALEAIVDVLNFVERHYDGSTTRYDLCPPPGNAESLLCVLRDGVEAETARLRRLKSGNPSPEDIGPRPTI